MMRVMNYAIVPPLLPKNCYLAPFLLPAQFVLIIYIYIYICQSV